MAQIIFILCLITSAIAIRVFLHVLSFPGQLRRKQEFNRDEYVEQRRCQ